MFPIFFGFRGGKGVLTTAAVLLMIYPPILAVDFSLFLILALATKYVSLGSIMAAATFPLWGWLFNYFVFYKAGAVSLQYMVISTLLLAVMGACVVAKHHANIGRLIHHTEKKFTLHHD
jgi:glycerol-3-phosphate acyltransferase PlsY